MMVVGTKEENPMPIRREEHDGKVSLFIQPLSGGALLSLMRIRADISPPDAGRRTPKIEIFFHGSAYAGQGGRMSVGDARTWARSLNALIAEAEKVAEEMQVEEKDSSETT
jgi:hypothetical protein